MFVKLTLLIVSTLALGAQARFPLALQAQWGHLDNIQARVVNGTTAATGEAPFQISLLRNYIIIKSHTCGGSLIANNVVVTAAHCTDG